MFEDIKKEADLSMSKAIESLNSACSKIRAGRPNPSMLDHVEADYFDVKTPLKQLANITVTDAATISLNVWDKTAIQAIEKAILSSNLGLSPVINGLNIHIKIPPLTQERRNDLIKVLKKESRLEQMKKNPYKRVDSENMTDIEKMDRGFNGKTFSINGIEIDV